MLAREENSGALGIFLVGGKCESQVIAPDVMSPSVYLRRCLSSK